METVDKTDYLKWIMSVYEKMWQGKKVGHKFRKDIWQTHNQRKIYTESIKSS